MRSPIFFSLTFVVLLATVFEISSPAPTANKVSRSPEPLEPIYLSHINGTPPLIPRQAGCYQETELDLAQDLVDVEQDITVESVPGFDDELRVKSKRQNNGYECSNGANPDPGTGPVFGNAIAYSDFDALQAGDYGLYLLESGQRVYSFANTAYPRRFYNRERIASVIAHCGGTSELWEYPLLESLNTYLGGQPGADRVIFSNCAVLCGVVTHRGRLNNRFHECPEF
jgi:hypothetical protein